MRNLSRRMFLAILIVLVAVPVTQAVDTLYVFTNQTDYALGGSVASAGDVNNDGYDDLIVSSSFPQGFGFDAKGKVYVFSGLNGDTLYFFAGEANQDQFGWSVAGAGDVNNDGFADLIVSAPSYGMGAGRAYVFSGLNGDTLHIFNNVGGLSVASAGDANNDGFADLIVGGGDRAIVFSGLNGDTLYTFTEEATGDSFGWSVASAGDINNDGHSDLMIGAPDNDAGAVGAGRVYIFSGLNGDTLLVFTGNTQAFGLGRSVASAGDVNNDGFADLIIGSGGPGRAYVFSGLNGDTLYVFSGESATDRFGFSVASAGDINNDGYSDLIVGAFENDAGGQDAGRAYVFSGLNGDTLFVFTGEAEFGWLGSSVASAGDVNNDGFADIIIGAPTSPPSGKAYVFSGAPITSVGDATVAKGSSFEVPITLKTNVPLNGFTIPLRYNTIQPSEVLLDSVTLNPRMDATLFLDTANQIFVFRRPIIAPPLPDSNHAYYAGTAFFSTTQFVQNEVFTIDTTTATINGTTFSYELVDTNNVSFVPAFRAGTITIGIECIGTVGNVDVDPNEIVDISDLTLLIDHLFINFPPLARPAEANIDGDPAGTVDITDLTALIDHLFINFPLLPACP